jgi:hypothetical protein
MFHRLSLLTLAFLLPAGLLRAESWPEMSDFVPKCPLIVHARVDHTPREIDGRTIPADVVEVLSGDYHPQIFAGEPPRGCIIVSGDHSPAKGAPARELIVFYGHNSHDASGLLTRPDMVLVAENDAIVYPPQGEVGETKSYSLTEFKRMVKAIASDIAPDKAPSRVLAAKRAASRPNHPLSWDLSGEWRMFLPAGFEHPITLNKLGEGRYEMLPSHLNGSGIYEVDGKDLVFAKGDPKRGEDAEAGAYRWTVTSKHLLTLTKQTHKTGSDYVGAILFRPKEKK